MINILHIETSSKNCSVAISTNGELSCLCEEVSQDLKHSESLHTFMVWALEGAELEIKDIHAVAVGQGPGSYTGLRIGIAAAKGLCFGSDIPLISINSLEILAVPFFTTEYDYIIPIMDARRMEVYMAVFNREGELIENAQPHILELDSFEKFRDKKILFVGDAVEKTKTFFSKNSIQFSDSKFIQSYPSAKNMIVKSYKKYQNKTFEDIAYFNPLYLKEWSSK